MNGLNTEGVAASFNVNETHSADGHPPAGVEDLNQFVALG